MFIWRLVTWWGFYFEAAKADPGVKSLIRQKTADFAIFGKIVGLSVIFETLVMSSTIVRIFFCCTSNVASGIELITKKMHILQKVRVESAIDSSKIKIFAKKYGRL